MNRVSVKTLVCIIAFLTVLIACPFRVSADMPADGLDSEVEKERLILERDALNDTLHAYEAEREAIDGRLLNLKLDQEWFDLKLRHIQDQDRLVPQALIESRKLLTDKATVAAGEKQRLLELIQTHKLTLGTLDARIRQNQDKILRKNPIEPTGTRPVRDLSARGRVAVNLEKELTIKINAMGIKDWVKLINDDAGIRLEVQLPILFASGRSTINSSYDGFLEKIATLVKPHKTFIHVKGVTDGARSRKISNIDLGARRAAAIVNQLVANGLPPSIFKITSRGEYQEGSHVDKNSPLLNRRAEITVYFPQAG